MSESKIKKPKMTWFKHHAIPSEEKELQALEVDYPLIGYAMYYKFKEMILCGENQYIEITPLEVKIMCKNFGSNFLTPSVFMDIIKLMAEYKMIQLFDEHFTMPQIETEIDTYKANAEAERKRIAEYRERKKQEAENRKNDYVQSTNTDVHSTNTDVYSTNADVLESTLKNLYNNKYINNNNNIYINNFIDIISTARLKKSSGGNIDNDLIEIERIVALGIIHPDVHNYAIDFLLSCKKKNPPVAAPPPAENPEPKKKRAFSEKEKLKWESYRACKDEFEKYYVLRFPKIPPYTILQGTADNNNLNRLILKIQQSMQASDIEITPESTAESFSIFLELSKNHTWVNDNLNISNLLNQYNVILQKSQNNGTQQTISNNRTKKSAISDDYKQRLINSLLAGQSS